MGLLQEPLLGVSQVAPGLLHCCLPTSSTCQGKLFLPIGVWNSKNVF